MESGNDTKVSLLLILIFQWDQLWQAPAPHSGGFSAGWKDRQGEKGEFHLNEILPSALANRNVMLNGTSHDGCECYFLIDFFCNENFVHCFISRLLQSSRKHSSWPSSSRVVRHRFRLPPARRRLQLLARLRLRSLRQQLWLDLPPCPIQQFWWDSAYTSLHTDQAHGKFFLQRPWVKVTHGICRMDFGLFGVVVLFQSCWWWHNIPVQTHLCFTMVIRNSCSRSTGK